MTGTFLFHRISRPLSWTAGAAIALLIAGCTTGGGTRPSGDAPFSNSEVGALIEGLPHRSFVEPPAMFLTDDVLPPTNRWYSGLAFGEQPQPVFPAPLSFALVDEGFAFGLPVLDVTPHAIHGAWQGDVTVRLLESLGRPLITQHGPVAVGLEYQDQAGEGVATVHLASGWPVIGLIAERQVEVALDAQFLEVQEDLWTATVNDRDYGLVLHDGALDGGVLTLEAGGWAQWFPVPTDGSAVSMAEHLGAPVTSVTTEFSVGDDVVTTSLTYENGSDTRGSLVAIPHDRAHDAGIECLLGSFPTIIGDFSVCAADQVTWTSPSISPQIALDIDGISDGERQAIVAALREDATSAPAPPHDSYFGAKALYRLANLLVLAEELGEDDLAHQVGSLLGETLALWTEPDGCETRGDQCFIYDPAMHGLVGLAPAFGSEEFNDHHFHYGYLLYAAAVAITYDPALEDTLAPVMDLIAAHLASAPGGEHFPEWRVFDPFAGHSWASGTAPFTDGNNQESSSEAVTAWTGLALWAQARENASLADAAVWMLSTEAASGIDLWLRPDLSFAPGYAHQIVSIQWGGKRDYATWFSDAPSASLGIQLIPMVPTAMEPLAGEQDSTPDRIRSAVAEAGGGDPDEQFADYLLMYQALAGADDRADAWEQARALPADIIDNANSRAYMLAWIASVPE